MRVVTVYDNDCVTAIGKDCSISTVILSLVHISIYIYG